MDVQKNVISLFDELIAHGERIKEECRKHYFSGAKTPIDAQGFEAWRTSCLTLLRSTFGSSSPHCDSFMNLKFFDHYNSTLLYLGILQGARQDLHQGYFYHKDLMLSVNVLNAFLARASRFAENGDLEKAAGVLEAVVCEALRKLVDAQGLPSTASATMADAAEALCRAGALREEPRDRIWKLAESVQGKAPFGGDRRSFSAWAEWARAFIHENLGSRIVIVN
jgi:hypothetical protein